MDQSDLDNRFDFHAATTEEKRGEHTSVREKCRVLATVLNDRLPEGREKSLAVTHLEETMFWANAAIARANTGGAPPRGKTWSDLPEDLRPEGAVMSSPIAAHVEDEG